MKKKICFITTVPSAVEAFLKEHIVILSTEYEISVVTNLYDHPDYSLPNISELKSIGITRKINIIKDTKALVALTRYFHKNQFSVIHSVTPKAGLLTAIAGFIARTPNRIHTYTGQVWATKKGVAKLVLMLMDKIISILDTQLLVDGHSQQQYLIHNHIINKKNSFVIGAGSICGVNTQRFNPNVSIRYDTRAELGVSNKVVYVFLGRLNRDKGIEELLCAFNMIVTRCPDAYLLLVGNDEEQTINWVQKYPNIIVGDNCCFYGSTPNPEIILQAGDVFCLPTYREGFGSSVIEASCLGLPVICSDVYGVMDAMVDDITGLRCTVKDPQSLYKCMLQLYGNKQLREKLGTNGRHRVLDNFACEIITKEWLYFYKSLVDTTKTV